MFKLPFRVHVSTDTVLDLVVEVEHDVVAALDPASDGGRKITKDEARAIGQDIEKQLFAKFGDGSISVEQA